MPLKWTDRLLGAALIVLAAQEYLGGHLGVATGELYGRRAAFFPLLPAAAMIALWLLLVAAGALLASGRRRDIALTIGSAALALSLTQSYFNQKMFLLLVLVSLALESPKAARAQLLLLYIASAAFKLRDGFASGAALSALLTQIRVRDLAPFVALPLSLAPLAAKLSLAAEALLPLALWKSPRAGVAGVIALHLGFCLCVPGIWAFGLACAGAALLFLPAQIALE